MIALKTSLTSYSRSTTLHGFGYISSSNNLIEKIFWSISVIVSVICCIFLFYELTVNIQNNPIVVYRPDIAINIKNIPFPAISFCSLINYNDSYQLYSSLLTTNNASYPFDINTCYDRYNCGGIYYDWRNLALYLQNELFINGIWMEKISIKYQYTISFYGWCTTFNLLGEKKIFYENKTAKYFREFKSLFYKNQLFSLDNQLNEAKYTPKKEHGFHGIIEQSFNELLRKGCKGEFKKICLSTEKQTRVVIHPPTELIDPRHQTFVISNREIHKIYVLPSIKITDETLLGLDTDERKCYKSGERKLKFFKNYTAVNCLKECESDFLMKECGCVPYYMINNDTSLVCKNSETGCFKNHLEKFMAINESFCKCYPPCEATSYEIIIKKLSSSLPSRTRFNSINDIRVNFKVDSVYPQIRRKYFTMIDWFSFVGGFLGLFFGFSFISGFEIVFHLFRGIHYNERNEKLMKIRKSWIEDSKMTRFVWKVRRYMKSFFKSSYIHGLSYIGDENLKTVDRLSWVLTFILSITACGFMIIKLRIKWEINSISFVTSETYINMTEIPFPAVTINGINKDRTNGQIARDIGLEYNVNYPDYEEYFKDDEFQFHLIAQYLAKNEPQKAMKFMSKYRPLGNWNFQYNLTNYGHMLIEAISSVSNLSFTSNINAIWIQNVAVPRAKVIVNDGNAFSFNMIEYSRLFEHENISKDFFYNYTSFYPKELSKKIKNFPWTPTYTNNDILKLSFTINSTSLPKVFLHSPYEYPFLFLMEAEHIFDLRHETTIEVNISPEIITTDKDLSHLSPNDRMCFIENERRLKFFKIYTKKNCEIECFSMKLLSSCNCVPYDIIRDKNTKICELFDYICVERIKNELLNDNDVCNCLQPCNFIGYNFEFIEIPHRKHSNEGIVKFKFKENEYVSMQRVRQFTTVDFLSYIGGLLGLFAGISVLTLFEIVDFFTIRLLCEFYAMLENRKQIKFIKAKKLNTLNLVNQNL
ncbi:uncharacterized protein [Chironomus tepperi]